MSSLIFLDIECYYNYFLIYFKSSKSTKYYQLYPDSSPLELNEIRSIMEKYTTIGFNSKKYDLWMIAYALEGAKNNKLKKLSDALILSKKPCWEIGRNYNLHIPKTWDHIDIIGPAPSVGISLKMYGARMYTKIVQDLPFPPNKIISKKDHLLIREYCLNDVNITMDLYEQIKDRVDLRKEMEKTYNIKLTSKSDAQVAEAVLKDSLGITKYSNNSGINKDYRYIAPSFIKFNNLQLIELKTELEQNIFKCNDRGKLIKNTSVRKTVQLDNMTFSVGIGGLHSNEQSKATIVEEGEFLIDIDVISYYPSIILNNEYYPEIVGKGFLDIYKKFYEDRIEAKNNKDKIKSETYKIILNGSFGKFGSPYSFLYSPSLLLHTTLTGQLSLLMLIEEIIAKNFKIISTNTDSITILGNKKEFRNLEIILDQWQYITQFKLELTPYKAIYHESVNSYIALLNSNTIKCKGIYASDGLSKNPVAPICKEAVIQYLTQNVLIEETIFRNKLNIKKFLIIRKVKEGALYNSQYLGTTVRWYYGLKGDKITYKKNGNKVAGSDGAVPLMVLPDSPPTDINLELYHIICYKMLKRLGVNKD